MVGDRDKTFGLLRGENRADKPLWSRWPGGQVGM